MNHVLLPPGNRIRLIVILMAVATLVPILSTEARQSADVVFADSFATNSLDQYEIEGQITWNEEVRNITLAGNPESALYSDRSFGNKVVVTGEVYIPEGDRHQYGSVALALRDEQQNNVYWATLAYGSSLSQQNEMSIMLNDSWGETASIALESGQWFHIKIETRYGDEQQFMQMKAWQRGDAEPSGWQVSRSLPMEFSVDGVGFRHYGNGTRADNLVVHSSEQIDLPWKDPLPKPVVEDHPEWVDLYWAAWQIASGKVQHGTEENGFVDSYLDEGFNDHIFQWDTCFMMFFANYANGFVPSIVSLDNFYRSQHADGAIDREILESDGSDYHDQDDLAYTNPPLFAWTEWDYYQTTGDSSRFDRVLQYLDDYYNWTRRNRRSANGMYRYNNLGSGMDNSPRPENNITGWIDYTAQQALAARYIAKMAGVTGNSTMENTYRKRYQDLKERVNQLSWNESDGYYWDVGANNEQIKTKTAASFWPMLAGIADSSQAAQLVEHLKNPDEFYRPHLFPTLSADHTAYAEDGGYWRGGVWAPTNVMYIKGLQRTGYETFATEAARNHLVMMTRVYNEVEPHSIWENYAPESANPGSPARSGFVGWSGNGPITLLIENILGFRPDAPADTLVWRPTLTGRHGIRDLAWGNHTTSIIADARPTQEDSIVTEIEAESSFVLTVRQEKLEKSYHIQSGRQSKTIPGRAATGLTDKPESPSEFRLGSNFPNPFNPVTTIPYELAKATRVSISVYDASGRKVRSLIKGKRQSPGTYQVKFDAADMSSGVYYYRLTTENGREERTMLLLK